MLRRLSLSPFVIHVRLVAEEVATLYVVILSFLAFALQASFTPFKDDNDDRLALLFMANEFLLA